MRSALLSLLVLALACDRQSGILKMTEPLIPAQQMRISFEINPQFGHIVLASEGRCTVSSSAPDFGLPFREKDSKLSFVVGKDDYFCLGFTDPQKYEGVNLVDSTFVLHLSTMYQSVTLGFFDAYMLRRDSTAKGQVFSLETLLQSPNLSSFGVFSTFDVSPLVTVKKNSSELPYFLYRPVFLVSLKANCALKRDSIKVAFFNGSFAGTSILDQVIAGTCEPL